MGLSGRCFLGEKDKNISLWEETENGKTFSKE